MTHPIAKARLRPMIAPTLAPVIISAAITSVYGVIAPWIPVTVVPTSFATVAIETFITELSSVIRNWPDASVRRTSPAEVPRAAGVDATVLTRTRVRPRPWRPSGRRRSLEVEPRPAIGRAHLPLLPQLLTRARVTERS